MLTLSNQSSEPRVTQRYPADNLKETIGDSRLPWDTQGCYRATLGYHEVSQGTLV